MFMLVLVFLGLAAAAPHYNHGYDRLSDIGEFQPSTGSHLFDSDRFWADFELKFDQQNQFWKDFELKFNQQNQFWKDFESRFSQQDGQRTSISVVGDKYKVTYALSDFEEKDIAVKARTGVLSVEANDGAGKSQLLIRTMPESVDATAGVWTFENHVLTIEFPIKGRTSTPPTTEVTRDVETMTEEPNYSREEVETDQKYDDQDADVGVQTNEIPKVPVEATTYAVDFSDQAAFVPVHYRK